MQSHPLLAWLLGWLVPGAGHLYLGRRAQGWAFLGALGGCFVAGALMGRGGAVSAAHPEYLVLQFGEGVPGLVAYAWSLGAMPEVPVARMDTAILYTLLPGMLNLVAAMDAAVIAAGRRAAGPEVPAPEAPAPGEMPPADGPAEAPPPAATGEPGPDAEPGSDEEVPA